MLKCPKDGPIRSSRAGFKPGFVSYQVETAFTKGSGTQGKSIVDPRDSKPGLNPAREDRIGLSTGQTKSNTELLENPQRQSYSSI